MRPSVLVLSTVLAIAPLASGASPLKAASSKAYQGDNGQQVLLVRLAAPRAKEALLHIQGTDSELDGKILLVEVDDRDGKADYATYELRKGRYVLLTVRNGAFTLYLPSPSGGEVRLRYDEKATREQNRTQAIIAEYQAAHP